MQDDALIFLVSLAAVPACAEEGGETDDDDASPPEGLREACEAALENAFSCYDSMGDTPEGRCAEYERTIERYGIACATAYEEWFACASKLNCAEIEQPLPSACFSTYASAHAACPEQFPFCRSFDYEQDDGAATCAIAGTACVDERRYEVSCASNGSGYDCTCAIDGAAAGSFTGSFECDDPRIAGFAERHCGFPEGVPSSA